MEKTTARRLLEDLKKGQTESEVFDSDMHYENNRHVICQMLKKYYYNGIITLDSYDMEKMEKEAVFEFMPISVHEFLKSIGFKDRCISFHQDEAPIRTYEFHVD